MSQKNWQGKFELSQLTAGVNFRAKKIGEQKSLIVCKPNKMPVGINIEPKELAVLNLPRPMELFKPTQAYGAAATAISLHILRNQKVVCVLCFPVDICF